MLQEDYGKDVLSMSQIFRLYKAFNDRTEDNDGEQRAVRPLTY